MSIIGFDILDTLCTHENYLTNLQLCRW